MRLGRTALVVSGMLLLTACSSPPSTPAQLLDAAQIKQIGAEQKELGHVEQAAALEDGIVTQDEYTAAFEDLSECFAVLGYPPLETWESPIDGISIVYLVPPDSRSDSVREEEFESCHQQHWNPISAVYQDTAPIHMDEPLRQRAIECIGDAGFELTGDEQTAGEMAGADPVTEAGPSERWTTTVDCLQEAQTSLFPEIPIANVTAR